MFIRICGQRCEAINEGSWSFEYGCDGSTSNHTREKKTHNCSAALWDRQAHKLAVLASNLNFHFPSQLWCSECRWTFLDINEFILCGVFSYMAVVSFCVEASSEEYPS
jgi:hypothetical protein